jgi:hypothetical protein
MSIQPISFVMSLGVFGITLSALYTNPIVSLMLFGGMMSWLAVCMEWGV